MTADADIAVIGAGLVGSAVALGLARRGQKILLLDGDDTAFRAARGNFGLVWVQSKGRAAPHYQNWTLDASDAWPEFAAGLREATGIDTRHRRPGGVHLCLGEAEFAERAAMMAEMQAQNPQRFSYSMLRSNELAQMLPGLGPAVTGGSYTPMDGDCDPLRLLRALHAEITRLGGRIVTGVQVDRILPESGGYQLRSATQAWHAGRVVIAAGLGASPLAAQVGLDIAIRPLRGQILVTERLPVFLDRPTTSIRQTGEGTVQLGDSQEDVGFDTGTTTGVIRDIAARAAASFPALAESQVVRSWGALRVMTPDGLPVYVESADHPGAFFCTCHSGVTLAPQHAGPVAAWIAGMGPAPDPKFSHHRFHATGQPDHVSFT